MKQLAVRSRICIPAQHLMYVEQTKSAQNLSRVVRSHYPPSAYRLLNRNLAFRLCSSHRLLLCLTRRGKCTYNVYWGAFRQPLLQWKCSKNYISSARVCRLRYPARNAHAPNYFVVYGPSGCTVFFNTRLSEKKIRYSQNLYFDFLCNVCQKHFSV